MPKVQKDSAATAAQTGKHKAEVRHYCKDCDASFTRRNDLERHINTFHRTHPYVCEEPGCKFSTAQNCKFLTHGDVHCRRKPHGCPHCDKSYTDPASLKRHRTRAHKDLKDWRLTPGQHKRGNQTATLFMTPPIVAGETHHNATHLITPPPQLPQMGAGWSQDQFAAPIQFGFEQLYPVALLQHALLPTHPYGQFNLIDFGMANGRAQDLFQIGNQREYGWPSAPFSAMPQAAGYGAVLAQQDFDMVNGEAQEFSQFVDQPGYGGPIDPFSAMPQADSGAVPVPQAQERGLENKVQTQPAGRMREMLLRGGWSQPQSQMNADQSLCGGPAAPFTPQPLQQPQPEADMDQFFDFSAGESEPLPQELPQEEPTIEADSFFESPLGTEVLDRFLENY